MVKEWLERQLMKQREKSTTPWASFEVTGFEEDGRVKISTAWNKAFIEKIYALGFQAETEDDSVQLFFYTSQMRPTSLDGVDEQRAHSAEHPNLGTDKRAV